MLYFPRWKRLLVWLVVIIGVVVALPNILPQALLNQLPTVYSKLHLPMGVDLQGGSRLVVQLPKNEIAERDATIDVMKRRLDIGAAGFEDYSIAKQSRDKIRIEVPGLFDVQLLKDIVSVTVTFFLTLLKMIPVKRESLILAKWQFPRVPIGIVIESF